MMVGRARTMTRWLPRLKVLVPQIFRLPQEGAWREDVSIICASGLFDREYYLATYVDVARSGIDPLEHYVRYGAAEFRNPSAVFDTRFYLESNPDVLASGINPLTHYCQFGKGEGRRASPVRPDSTEANGGKVEPAGSTVDSRVDPTRRAHETIMKSGIFDRDFYCANNPLLAVRNEDPVQHYLGKGAKALQDPSPYFSTEYYLSSNPDVALSGMNPLLHFCRYGGRELRDPSPAFDMGRYWAIHLAGTEGSDANPLTHYVTVGRREKLQAYATNKIAPEDKEDLLLRCRSVLEQGISSELSARRLAAVLHRLGDWPLAEKALRKALDFNWNDAKVHSTLADVLEKQGKWWQAAEFLANATSLDSKRPTWFYRLGAMQERMGRFALAAIAYRRAIDAAPPNAFWQYRLGYVLERSGSMEEARSCYAKAAALDQSLDARQFGEGVFHQQREYWPEAATAYCARLQDDPLNPDLWYRLGFARDRCMEWESACDALSTAIALKPDVSYWHYRLGLLLERLGRFSDAAEAYEAAIAISGKHMSYWLYRCGYVLHLCGRYEEACAVFTRVRGQGVEPPALPEEYRKKLAKPELLRSLLGKDMLDASRYAMLGRQHEHAGEWCQAADLYAEACRRQNQHDADLYHRLGNALWKSGQAKAACRAFLEMVILRRPTGLDTRRYTRTEYQARLVHYNEYRECLPVLQQTMLYESYGGRSISDNPLAIFDYVSAAPGYERWIHVWVVTESTEIPHQLRTMPNVILVRKNSDLYLRYLATASHLVNNATFPPWFIRRPEQKYLNTWHGTPLKTLMKDIKGTFMERTNSARNLLHCTHVISPNEHTSDVLIRGSDIAGVFTGKIAETGYPRIDRLVNSTEGRRDALRSELGIDRTTPVVLYAPTWRGTFGGGEIEADRILSDLERMSVAGCQLLFRGHYSVAEKLDGLSLPVKVVPQRVDTCDLLAVTDVLITDYSSILFDFLPARRPMIFYAYDLTEYAEQRGLYFRMTELPGTLCTSIDEVVPAIQRALKAAGPGEGHDCALARFCPHEDGLATRRAVEFFIDDSTEHVTRRYEDSRKSILIYAGAFPPQGITSSALNLLGSLDYERYKVTVVIDPDAVAGASEKLERFSMLPPSVQVVGRAGAMVGDAVELWVRNSMNQRYSLPGRRMFTHYMDLYRREFDRAFGGARFDAVVNFDGYSTFWTSLLGAAPAPRVRKTAYMHSDMYAEMTIRFPSLGGVFSILGQYDALVSVSPQLCGINRTNLSERFAIAGERFTYCENPIDIAQIRKKAAGALDLDVAEWIKGRKSFLALGRLSPEKDQAKLVRAFGLIQKSCPESVLVIIGDGPLRQEIEQIVAELGLDDAVLLGGQRSNPFPILAACDCLVMSSNHEGQPMVLLEAMALGVPVVATDIDGNRGLLVPNGYGLLVDNSVQGLADGLRAFLAGGVPVSSFDAEAYQRRVIDSFYREVVG